MASSSSLSSSVSSGSIRDTLLSKKEQYDKYLHRWTSTWQNCLPQLIKELRFCEDAARYSYKLDDEKLKKDQGVFEELQFHQESIRTFLDSSFDDFYDKFVRIVEELNTEEFSSSKLSISQKSPSYKKIDELFQILVSNFFCDLVPSNKMAFWSGKAAKKHFQSDSWYVEDGLSDLQIPVYKALFGLTDQIDDNLSKEVDLKSLFKRLVCMHIAYRAKGDVSVYVSTDGSKSLEPFLRVGNHFWNLELPILQKLKRKGTVTNINFRFLTMGGWVEKPMEIASDDAKDLKLVHLEKKESKKCVFIYPETKEFTKIKYKPVFTGQEITLGKLKEIIARWREIAQKRALERATPKDSIE